MKLMNGLLYEGRVLYTDNFYTSVPLAEELLTNSTYICGTVKQARKYLPGEAKTIKNGVIVFVPKIGKV
jgi:hypothetical protein